MPGGVASHPESGHCDAGARLFSDPKRLLKRLSALMSIVILNETVTFLQVHGGAVTVVGVVIAQMAQASRKSNEPPWNSKKDMSHRSDQ